MANAGGVVGTGREHEEDQVRVLLLGESDTMSKTHWLAVSVTTAYKAGRDAERARWAKFVAWLRSTEADRYPSSGYMAIQDVLAMLCELDLIER
jgi:hypothetical protein